MNFFINFQINKKINTFLIENEHFFVKIQHCFDIKSTLLCSKVPKSTCPNQQVKPTVSCSILLILSLVFSTSEETHYRTKRERTRKENIDEQYYNRKICRVVFLTSRTFLVESVNAVELASISGMFENNVQRSF